MGIETILSDDKLVKCPWCLDDRSLKEWNDATFAECRTREMRRAFRSLKNKSVWGKESKNFYKCPNCGNWSRGNKLRIISDNPELNTLGNEPLFEVSNTL